MISDIHTLYASGLWRHGRSRLFSRYQFTNGFTIFLSSASEDIFGSCSSLSFFDFASSTFTSFFFTTLCSICFSIVHLGNKCLFCCFLTYFIFEHMVYYNLSLYTTSKPFSWKCRLGEDTFRKRALRRECG